MNVHKSTEIKLIIKSIWITNIAD